MCLQQCTGKIYIHVHLKVHELLNQGFRVRIVYSRYAGQRIYLASMKKKNISRNKYGMVAWEDQLRCCL